MHSFIETGFNYYERKVYPFSITNITYADKQINATVALEPKSEVFAAHFPGYPLLPGVVMLNIVRQVCESYFNCPLVWSICDRVKFLQPISGDTAKTLDVNIQIKSDNPLQISSSINHDEAIAFKLMQGKFI